MVFSKYCQKSGQRTRVLNYLAEEEIKLENNTKRNVT